jgi:hypothetical protein
MLAVPWRCIARAAREHIARLSHRSVAAMPSAARSRQRGCRSGSSNSSSSRPGAWRQARLAHPLLAAVLAAGALLAGVPPAAAATPFPQFPVNWTNVPDTPQPAADLSSSCICALLNGTCTPGCCCDPACPPAVVSGHRAARSCLPEGPPPEQLTYCLPDEPFAHVRWGGCLGVRAWPRHVLCSVAPK